jgi:hypothetical protein
MPETDWQLQEAKARFSELVKSAQRARETSMNSTSPGWS